MQIPFDLNTDQLKTYFGTNPKPDDFDDFWKEALFERDKVQLNVEIKKADFVSQIANCYDLYFTSTKNVKVHTKMLVPKDKNIHPCIIKFHGLGGNAGEWTSLLPFVSEGYSVFAMDCRGQSGSSEDYFAGSCNYSTSFLTRGVVDALNGNYQNLYYRDIFLDCYTLYKIITTFENIDQNRIGVTGYSQGGGLTIALASLVPQIKCAAPVYPYLSDYQRVWDLDLAHDAYEGINEFFRNFDPHHKKENEFFNILGYIDVKNMAEKIKAKVLFTSGLKDTTCPPSTQFAIYNRLKCEKELNLFHDFDHEALLNLNDEIFQFFRNNL